MSGSEKLLSLGAWYSVLAQNSGRDKVAKFIAYFSKIIIAYRVRNGQTEAAEHLISLARACGQTRQFGRLFTFVFCIFPSIPSDYSLESLLKAYSTFMDLVFLISDSVAFASNFKLISLTPKTHNFVESTVGCWSWFLSMIGYVILGLMEWNTCRSRLRGYKIHGNQESIKEYTKRTNRAKWTFIKHLLDFQVALNLVSGTWNPTLIGIFGSANALIGLWLMLTAQ
eukprot:TRINITY_DN13420_c0_g1_i1.p1 TRINITY_DN13420_c0_g1~~TRINITY_DN13420_c0_g1_i1.p1  ORF type:complete len:226 (-),score=16.54 TRINITY_DN13420_c0_g1_i1:16-693(-)